MENLTEDRKYVATKQMICTSGLGAAASHKILSLTLTVPLSITAILGNILIIIALRKVSSLHPPSKLLLGCLACTDLGVGLISHPLLNGLFLSPERWFGCDAFWILFNTTGFVFAGISLLTMTAISVDRLLALLLGLRYRQMVTAWRVKVLIIALWLFSTLVAMVAFYSHRLALSIACAALVLCIVISTFCYNKIYRTLRLSQTLVQGQVSPEQPNGEGILLNRARYKKTVSTALWVQMALLACYLPFGFISVYMTAGLHTPSIIFAWALTMSLMYFNSTLNPFLYCWKMRELRKEVKNTVKQFFCLSG